MLAFVGVLTFYAVVAAIIEAALKGVERVSKGTWLLFYKGTDSTGAWNNMWRPICRWLMVVLSIVIIWKIGIFAIHTLAVNLIGEPESFSIGAWDPILTGLLVSRGSNVIHNLIEKSKGLVKG